MINGSLGSVTLHHIVICKVVSFGGGGGGTFYSVLAANIAYRGLRWLPAKDFKPATTRTDEEKGLAQD